MRLSSQIFALAAIGCLTTTAQQPANGTNALCRDGSAQVSKKVCSPAKDTPAEAVQDNSTPPAKDAQEQAPKDVSPSTPKDVSPIVPREASIQLSVIADRIFASEAALVENMHHYTPLVETYIQNLKPDPDLVSVPGSDRYFLGRLVLDPNGIRGVAFKDRNRSAFMYQVVDRLNSFFRLTYNHISFLQVVFLNDQFDKEHYELRYLRRQFLGEVRTLVFDVVPRSRDQQPYFIGRIWVEDQDYNIIRYNGTYGPDDGSALYFHFDSWRINMQPGLWLPAYIYVEESVPHAVLRTVTMKGQTRLWAYDLKHSGQQSEFTNIQVDSKDVSDDSSRGANEIIPVQSQHMWEREAEDNILDRMERAGVLAPDGAVSKVLQTVVNNLEITNNLNIDPEVRCRVLLTTPLESFTVGHTIVLSRGLLDVMPDEATLAMVLAQELGHIALGHRIDTRYAFGDRMLFPDERVFKQIGLTKNDEDERTADAKGLELLQKSPYKDKLNTAGLFLRALDARKHDLTWLISPHFGNRFTRSNLIHLTALESAPELEMRNLAQIPALPLGSRIKLDPWDDQVQMQKGKQVVLVSVRDKMSFEVTPMFPNLVRFGPPPSNEAAVKPGQ